MQLSSFVFGAIPLIIQYYAKKYMEDDKTATLQDLEYDFGIPRIKSYDFIVVGGGTAGCVVAGRLSERFNVLLLEAGGTPIPPAHVSYFTRDVAVAPDINYFYESVPQRNMSLRNGGISTFETGKMLGGSGSHNEMIHQRGSPLDWDGYAAMTGDATWRYENVLEFWKKSEDFVGQLINPEQGDYYGVGGPLTVNSDIPPIWSKWAEAAAELGFTVADPNAQQIPSFAPVQMLIGSGARVSTYTGYIKPFEEIRENLTVIRYANVEKILLDENNRAYGVAYSRHGIPQIAHASNEVILSAGAINSPLLLMMSGIGPRDALEQAEIPVKVAIPAVGQNLNDHIWILIQSFKFNASASPYIPRILEEELEAAFTTYLETGEGVLGQVEAGPQAFHASSRAVAEGEPNYSDVRITLTTMCPLSFSDDVDSWTACHHIELDRMKSRGSVTLNTSAYLEGVKDITKLAVIDFKAFDVASDLDVALDGIDLIFRIMEETAAFQSLGTTFTGTAVNGCTHLPFRSREYWACHVQQVATTAIHSVGTCSMGAVTDSKLRVMGVPGLRVVDASVLPYTPNANINGPVILVAEKAAQEISQQWGGVSH